MLEWDSHKFGDPFFRADKRPCSQGKLKNPKIGNFQFELFAVLTKITLPGYIDFFQALYQHWKKYLWAGVNLAFKIETFLIKVVDPLPPQRSPIPNPAYGSKKDARCTAFASELIRCSSSKHSSAGLNLKQQLVKPYRSIRNNDRSNEEEEEEEQCKNVPLFYFNEIQLIVLDYLQWLIIWVEKTRPKPNKIFGHDLSQTNK